MFIKNGFSETEESLDKFIYFNLQNKDFIHKYSISP